MNNSQNSFGLYDVAVPFPEKQDIALSRAELEHQLDSGAFFMDRDEAIRLGFIHPDHEPDTACVGIREEA